MAGITQKSCVALFPLHCSPSKKTFWWDRTNVKQKQKKNLES